MQRNLHTILLQDQAVLELALSLNSSAARIEVQCLLLHTMNVARSYLLAYPERFLSEAEEALYQLLLQRRLSGEPIAYILGKREFFGLMFKVTPATLIPRPETELLVELALERLPNKRPTPATPLKFSGEASLQRRRERAFRVLDLGTGSGAIALSIAHARPDLEVVASDASAEALVVARENARLLSISNTTLMQSDWYAALDEQCFGLIVSNPPYVAADDPHLLCGDLRFEPSTALASGADGLEDIRSIVTGAPAHLRLGGWLLLEHGYDQAERVRELMLLTGFSDVFSARDLAGIERVTGGRT